MEQTQNIKAIKFNVIKNATLDRQNPTPRKYINVFAGDDVPFISIKDPINLITRKLHKSFNLTEIADTGNALDRVINYHPPAPGEPDNEPQMCITALYYYHKSNAMDLLSAIPFGLNQFEWMLWQTKNGSEFINNLGSEYGIKIIPIFTTPKQFGFWSNINVQTMEDIPNLKIRMPGMGATVLSRLGAEVHKNIPLSETKHAYNDGVINSIEWGCIQDDCAYGLPDLFKNYYGFTKGWQERSTCIHLVINKAVWESIPSKYQNVLTNLDIIPNNFVLDDAYLQFTDFNALINPDLPTPHCTITGLNDTVLDGIYAEWTNYKNYLKETDPDVRAMIESIDNFKIFCRSYMISQDLSRYE